MTATSPDPRPGLLERVPSWAPIVLALLGLFATGVRADSRIGSLERSSTEYSKLVGDRTDRLARVETRLEEQAKSLARIERALERLEDRS